MLDRVFRLAGRWEVVLLELIVVTLIAGSILSPFFMNVDNLLSQTRDSMIIGFLALGLVPVVIMGEIDLSGEAIQGFSALTIGLLHESGVDARLAAVSIVILGALFGALNGTLVIAFGLPSLVVTLATLISVRGLAYVLVEDRPIVGFPEAFVAIGNGTMGSTPIPQSLIAFTFAAIPLWCTLRLSVFGRWIYATGSNSSAARLSRSPAQPRPSDRLHLLRRHGRLRGDHPRRPL